MDHFFSILDTPRKNGIFLALKGERVDGHDFASTAGGAFAFLEREINCPAIIVEDVMKAAAKWAILLSKHFE